MKLILPAALLAVTLSLQSNREIQRHEFEPIECGFLCKHKHC